jgi:serine protease
MKRLWLWIGLVIVTALQVQARDHQYRYSGGPRQFTLHTQHIYLLLEPGATQATVQQIVPGSKVLQWGEPTIQRMLLPVEGAAPTAIGRHWAEVELGQALSETDYEALLNRLNRTQEVAFAGPHFFAGGTEHYGVSEYFYVELNTEMELPGLLRTAAATHTHVIGKYPYLDGWYVLAVDKNSKGNALAMSQHFLETGRVKTAHPDVMVPNALMCVNDPLYPNQWGITNTGQYGGIPGTDVNACAAWSNWTTGSLGIRVAIFDQGVEAFHPDLAANIVDPGFDTQTGTAPSVTYGSHGVACAGIAGAIGNNNLGVTGIARNNGLVSISHSLFPIPGFLAHLALGFSWAETTGQIDVISNSWGWNISSLGTSPILEAAINSALTNGRGGLGMVVCFASGNANGAVSYPASYNPDILAVGAASPCGERKNPASCDGEVLWGSCFGPELDVIAPGVKIATTDRVGPAGYDPSDYAPAFNGTSSACPHVAGLAGLVLAMNPCLTRAQVNNIIERSARKTGPYVYAPTLGRPNGTWTNDAGYGFIDADAALRLTREIYVQNYTYTGNEVVQVFGSITAGYNVTPLIPVGDVNVFPGANVEYRYSTGASLMPGFNVYGGSTFSVYPIPFLNCGPWDETVARRAPLVAAVPVEATSTPATTSKASAGNGWQLSVRPNPVSEGAMVAFQMPRNSTVVIDLYDAQMRRVLTVLEAQARDAGWHEARLDASALPAGMYFLRLRGDGEVHAVQQFAVFR